MSETIETNNVNKKRRISFIAIIAVVVVLLLIYGGGIVALPLSILSNYESKNCGTALTLNNIYTGIYPTFIEDETLTGPVMECAVYTLASLNKDNGEWRDSYNAFHVYAGLNPNGVFAKEVHEYSATALTGLAKDQIADGRYAEALKSLNEIGAEYGGTSAAADAAGLYPEIYSTWAVDLQGAGDFEGAERILIEFKTWAQDENDANHSATVQGKLAQTYLGWGLALQSQKQFEAAKSKLDMAVSYSPELASQVQANEEKFYTEWGDYLITQKDFNGAMEQYETASALSKSGDPASASDIIANGYIQWAIGLSVEEDFIGALVLLDFAEENAATDSMKNRVGDARSDVYLAFSESNGEQARRVMDDVVEIICKHHIQPRLPIFGLDQENDLFGIYGVDDSLPEDIAAKTPGSLHYVACIEEDTKIIESEINTVGSFFFDPNPPYTSLKVQYNRVQYIWTVIVRKADTGNDVESTIVNGGEPPPLPTDPWEIVAGAKNPQYFGTKPSVADLVNWLLTVLR